MLLRRTIQFCALVVLWLLLVFKTDAQDIVAAVIGALLTLAAIHLGAPSIRPRFALPDGWISAVAPLPVKIIQDTGRVFAVLAGQAVRWKPAVGHLTNVPFDYGSNEGDDIARLGITLTAISVTPNTVAITTTPDAITLHQLSGSDEEFAGRNPEWPV